MLSTMIDDCLKLTDLGGEKFEFSPAQANKLVVVLAFNFSSTKIYYSSRYKSLMSAVTMSTDFEFILRELTFKIL